MRKEFTPKRGMNEHEDEENCRLRKFVTGKPNNGMKKSVKDKTGKTHGTQVKIISVNRQLKNLKGTGLENESERIIMKFISRKLEF